MRISVGTPQDGIILEGDALTSFKDSSQRSDDPVLEEVKRTIRAPLAEILVSKAGPQGKRSVFFAVGENLTSVVMSRPDQPQQVAAVTRESIPAIAARTVGLTPAPFVDERSTTLSLKHFEQLTQNPAEAEEIAGTRAFHKLFTRDDWSLWYIQRSTRDPNGVAEHERFDVVGAVDHGWWFLDVAGKRVHSERTRAAIIWTMLCAGI
ncbi:MAG: hypothetical protein ACTJFR_02510 [Canibacter sp.]